MPWPFALGTDFLYIQGHPSFLPSLFSSVKAGAVKLWHRLLKSCGDPYDPRSPDFGCLWQSLTAARCPEWCRFSPRWQDKPLWHGECRDNTLTNVGSEHFRHFGIQVPQKCTKKEFVVGISRKSYFQLHSSNLLWNIRPFAIFQPLIVPTLIFPLLVIGSWVMLQLSVLRATYEKKGDLLATLILVYLQKDHPPRGYLGKAMTSFLNKNCWCLRNPAKNIGCIKPCT